MIFLKLYYIIGMSLVFHYNLSVLYVQIIYAGSLLGLTLWKKDEEGSGDYEKQCAFEKLADKLVAYFSMIHVAVWVIVAVMDR